MEKIMRIAIAGASGFVGKNLIEALKSNHQIVAISRHNRQAQEHVEWAQCDLFSFSEIEKTLKGADIAVYLVI